MKRLLSVFLMVSLIFCLFSPVSVYAVGDGNVDGGGGGMGDGTSTNSWTPGNEGVRVTVIRVSDHAVATTPIDLTNKSPSSSIYNFGKVSKLQYNGGRGLSPVKGGYTFKNPAQSLPKIISTNGSNNIDAIKSYFTDEQVIRSIAATTGMSYDVLIGGDYKLLIEPFAFYKFEGVMVLTTATEAAMYDEQVGGLLRKRMVSLSHKNLPLAMFLEVADLGYPAWSGSRSKAASNAEIKSSLGLGIVRFKDKPAEPQEVSVYDYEYRVNTEVITAITVSGGQSDPNHPVSATFYVNGRSHRVSNIYYPDGDSQLAWIRWTTPSTPQHMTITVSVSGGGSSSKATINVNIVDLDKNPPPNPVADDRNDSFQKSAVPNKAQQSSASWTVWRPWWQEHWVWHSDWNWYSDGDDGGHWEDDGEWVDEGWWMFDLDRYQASLSASMAIKPDDKSPTASGKNMKSGYGINETVSAKVSTNQSSAVQKRVDIIPANILLTKPNARKRKLRVAAYCRVSTEQEEQQSSYAAQIAYYTDKISKNKDWELAGIFADEGITGTSAKKRTEFLKLMALCEKGKIDMVLTKSVSRFSRNTLDAIGYIRKLKAKGIPIIFEKEGINTMEMASEMALCFLSGFAQAESESISRNVTWGKRQSFKSGKVPFQYSRLLGYEKGEDGQPKIVSEEAEIVKRIFRSYYSGASVRTIKESLEADNILSPTGNTEWSIGALQYMLRNERYIGDALLQKTYVVDCLTKETRKNNGEIPQYYVTGNHEPIISKDLFNLVQEEIARRAGKRKVAKKAVKTEKGKYSSKYALTELLCCGDCGTQYRRVTWARNGKKKVVWRCINRLEYGTKYCKESPTIEESRLHQAIITALNRLDDDKADVMETLKAGLQLAIGTQDDDSFNEAAVQNRIAELQSVMMDLVELSSKSSAGADYFDAKFEEIAAEIKALQGQLGEHQEQTMLAQNTQARIHELLYMLEHIDLSVKEYRDDVVKGIISKVVVLSADRIRITFDNNMELEQELTDE